VTESTTDQATIELTSTDEPEELVKYKELLQWAADFCESNDIFAPQNTDVVHPLLGRLPVRVNAPKPETKLQLIVDLADDLHEIWVQASQPKDALIGTLDEMESAQTLHTLELDRDKPPVEWTPGAP